MKQTKSEKAHGVVLDKLAKLNTRKDELWVAGEAAKAELATFRKESAQALIEGQDNEKVASALAARESKAAMFVAALVEVATQVGEHEAIVAETEKAPTTSISWWAMFASNSCHSWKRGPCLKRPLSSFPTPGGKNVTTNADFSRTGSSTS